jgi:hypothetical protein
VREYVGGGIAGQLAALIDQERRTTRETDRVAWHAERAEIEQTEEVVKQLIETSAAITSGVLLVAGYGQHKRGEWRRRRE